MVPLITKKFKMGQVLPQSTKSKSSSKKAQASELSNMVIQFYAIGQLYLSACFAY